MFAPSWDTFRSDSLVLHIIEKSWDGGGATGSFRGNFRQAEEKSKGLEANRSFCAKLSEPSIFCRRLVLIPTWG